MKERLFKAVRIAALVTPPWNIFWWTVAAIRSAKDFRECDNATDEAAYILIGILSAPANMPLEPYYRWKQRQKDQAEQLKRETCRAAAAWIADALWARNISVASATEYYQSVAVSAVVADEQADAYRAVFADAVRAFAGRLTVEEICGNAKPMELFDKRWADHNGFTAWAEEIDQGKCVDCGAPPRRQIFAFGSKIPWHTDHYGKNSGTEYSLADGNKRIVMGFLCAKCLKQLSWRSSRPVLASHMKKK